MQQKLQITLIDTEKNVLAKVMVTTIRDERQFSNKYFYYYEETAAVREDGYLAYQLVYRIYPISC